MKVIMYAAGVAARMGEFTGGKPKSLLRVANRALIDYQLDWITRMAPKCVVIVLGLEHEAVRAHVGESVRGIPVVYRYNEDYRTKGNMLSLWCARQDCDDDIIFTTSDLVCPALNTRAFKDNTSPNKILVDNRVDRLADDDPVKVTLRGGAITQVKKRLPLDEVDGMAVGLYQFEKPAIQRLLVIISEYIARGDDNRSLYYPVHDLVAEVSVKPVFCQVSEWFDVDTPEEAEEARLYVEQNPHQFGAQA